MIGKDRKFPDTAKLEKEFKDLDTKYLKRSNNLKKEYNKYHKKLTKEQIKIFESKKKSL